VAKVSPTGLDAIGAELTAFHVFDNHLLLGAGDGILSTLRLELLARVTSTPGVQCALQRVALPSKEIVSMLPMASSAIERLALRASGVPWTIPIVQLTGRPCCRQTAASRP
jgi:hypothetical protein